MILSLILSAFLFAVPADTLEIPPQPERSDEEPEVLAEVAAGEVRFRGTTQIETFYGETSEIRGFVNPETGEFKFTVNMASLTTGNSRRDRNMHSDYLKTEEWPQSVFSGVIQDIHLLEEDAENNVKATGEFTIRDVTREVEIEGEIQRSRGEWNLSATFTLLHSDFSISRARFLFVRVRDEVEVTVSARLR